MHFRTQNRTHASLLPSIGYAIAGAAAWAYQDHAPAFLFLTAAFMWGASCVSIIAFVGREFSAISARMQRPERTSDEVRILEAIGRMDANQVWLAAYMLGYQLDDTPPDPVIDTGDGVIEKSFAISAVDRAAKKGGRLDPVRSYSDGTPERRNMQLLTNLLVAEGLAEPPAGNQPAKLRNYTQARRRILE